MAQDPEKIGAVAVGNVGIDVGSGSGSDSRGVSSGRSILNEFTPEETRKIVHRVDRRLVSVLGLMFCISLIDRLNMGNAAVAGMKEDLDLDVGFRYSTVTLLFYPAYIIFQIPATTIIRWIGPRHAIASFSLLFGILMIGTGFVHKWTHLAGLRVILGILEAGVFPGSIYLLSTWYVRYEVHKRYSIFYFIGEMSTAFSGMLAYGIMHMDGIAGLRGWRWIFILEGIITCIIALCGYIFIVGFPDQDKRFWWFLSERETRLMVARVNADRGDAKPEPFQLRKYLAAGLDLKLWGFALMYCMTATVANALNYSLPIILREGMGFSVGESQYLTAPPYLATGLMAWAAAVFGDIYHVRGPIIIFNAVVSMVGLAVMGWAPSVGIKYFGVFITCMGTKSNTPSIIAWQANNVRGQWKRALSSATLVGFGGVGGIIGASVFRHQDAPSYHPGLWACLACDVVLIALAASMSAVFARDNGRAARGEMVIEGAEREGEEELGFRYTL